MKKNILLLEDDAATLHFMAERLDENDFDVVPCRRIDQAKRYFDENHDDVDCIVADLNMSDEWLNEYRNESMGGMLAGWVWLRRFVYPTTPNIPTVIYSGFVDDLMKNLSAEEKTLLFRDNVACISKGVSGGIEAMIEAINGVVSNGEK